MMDASELLADIERTFGDVALGDCVSLHQSREIDRYQPDAVARAVRGRDPETRWQDISDEKIERLSDTLTFMDAAGMRFHLPRFMRWAIENAERQGLSYAVNASIYACRHPRVEQFGSFDDPQRRTVARFLRFASGRPDVFDAKLASRALAGAWRHWDETGGED